MAGDAASGPAPDPASSGGPSSTRARGATRRSDTKDPHRSRERALKILFQADIRGVPADGTLGRLAADPAARSMLDDVDELGADPKLLERVADDAAGRAERVAGGAPGIDGFTHALVLGVVDHQDRIDALIRRYARRWQIHRMPVVDRTVLRLATYELLHEPTPPAVVIDEAVSLAKALSTDDSGRYVNGVLESIRKDVAAQQADPPSA